MYLTVSEIYTQATTLVAKKTKFTTRGWVQVHRSGDAGKLQFIWFSDGSTIKDIQAVYHGLHPKIDYLASIEITGILIPSPARGQEWEITAETVQVVGECSPDHFPLPRKKLPLPVLREYPHLRMRTKTIQAVMRIRHRLWMSIMEFFHHQGYISMHTPLITSSDCEGAGEAFKVDGGKDFFPTEAFLTVSGQLQGEMAATALGKIFTCGPTFRAEHSDTHRHLSEFWMVEPEMAWHDLDDCIKVAEDLIDHCVADARIYCKDELKELKVLGQDAFDGEKVVLEFKRITYTEAIDIIRAHAHKFTKKDGPGVPEWGQDLGTPHERFLVDEHFQCPLVVTHYPKDLKAFYMHQDPDGKTVACFDLLLPGIGEVIGGSQREIRLDLLTTEMQHKGLDLAQYQRYLDLRRFGSVPHSGFGLGFERLVRYVTGMEHIRDVIPFPVYYKHIS